MKKPLVIFFSSARYNMLNQQKIEEAVTYKFRLVVVTMTDPLIGCDTPVLFIEFLSVSLIMSLYYKVHDAVQV